MVSGMVVDETGEVVGAVAADFVDVGDEELRRRELSLVESG